MKKRDLSFKIPWGDGIIRYTPSASLKKIFWKEVGRIRIENPNITEEEIYRAIEVHKDRMSCVLFGINALVSISLKSHLLQLTGTPSRGWNLISQACNLIEAVAQEVVEEKERMRLKKTSDE